MVYVALLRGINVGGNNKVEMAKLKVTFERLGFTDVTTYINSGNVIFKDNRLKPTQLVRKIEDEIENDFGIKVWVIVRDIKNIRALIKATPSNWTNDTAMKSDVLFLWEEVDSPTVLKQLTIKPEIETVSYVPGAILWSIDRKDANKNGMLKIIGTELYRKMTIRNVNTVRKLVTMMEDIT